jgi:hypothetical protein
MGAVQRDPRTAVVEYEVNGNGSYQTLYDKLPEKQGSLGVEVPEGIQFSLADQPNTGELVSPTQLSVAKPANALPIKQV